MNVEGRSPIFSTISLTWMAPLMENGVIRDYQITYFPTDDSTATTFMNISSSALEFNITGLMAFTNYSISVSAITVGIGDPSVVIIVMTNESSKF